MPALRSVKWGFRKRLAQVSAGLPVRPAAPEVVFIVGCGRSGTTHLGNVIAHHPQVAYLNEPIDLWYAIDRRTDFINFFGGKGECWLTDRDITLENESRAHRLFYLKKLLNKNKIIVEKLPSNSFRLLWLKNLFPNARFVHIVRDGRAVVKSIERLSKNNTYRVSGRYCFNQWWGAEFHKWEALLRRQEEIPTLDHVVAELQQQRPIDLRTMAAFEWLASIFAFQTCAADKWGSSCLYEVRYEDFVADPEKETQALLSWLTVDVDPGVVEYAVQATRTMTGGEREEIELPEKCQEMFCNALALHGYDTIGVSARRVV